MQEEFNLFPSGQVLEALCAWSDNLKSFQQRISKYFARSEAKGAAFDYIQAKLMSSGTEKRLADGRAGRVRQSIPLAALVGSSDLG
jgi:hypothetical protein